MNKYVLMLAASALIAAAPAYYAFQAQAEEAPASAAEEAAATPVTEDGKTAAPEANAQEPSAGETAPDAPSAAGNE